MYAQAHGLHAETPENYRIGYEVYATTKQSPA
jgi:hypothetical protein